MQAFIRLRSAVFAEDGYSFECPASLKGVHASFVVLNSEGKAAKVIPVPSRETPDADAPNVFVHLKPYVDATKAKVAVLSMCRQLVPAMRGNAKAARALGAAWSSLVLDGMNLKDQPADVQLMVLNNLFGEDRVTDALRKNGGLSNLGTPDYAELVPEALSRQP